MGFASNNVLNLWLVMDNQLGMCQRTFVAGEQQPYIVYKWKDWLRLHTRYNSMIKLVHKSLNVKAQNKFGNIFYVILNL